MQINEMGSTYGHTVTNSNQKQANTASGFADSLNKAANAGRTHNNQRAWQTPQSMTHDFGTIRIFVPGENTLASGNTTTAGVCSVRGGFTIPGVAFRADRAEGSTESDPKVFITGIDENGNNFEKYLFINDINPRNATWMEMRILNAYLGVGPFKCGGGLGMGMDHDSRTFNARGLNDRHDFLDEFNRTQDRLRGYGDINSIRFADQLQAEMQLIFDWLDSLRDDMRNNMRIPSIEEMLPARLNF